MKIRKMVLAIEAAAIILTGLLVPISPSWAQKAPPPANPQAPTVNPLTTTGIQRGQPLTLLLTGTNLANPTTSFGRTASYGLGRCLARK